MIQHSRIILDLVTLMLRRWPWESESIRWRFSNWAVSEAKRLFEQQEYREITTRNGQRLNVDIAEWLGRQVYVTGCYEPGVTRVIKHILKPGDHFIDVGANVGYFTVLAAHCVGGHGRVTAFEPNEHVRLTLQRNICLNGLENCCVRSEALSSEDGDRTFHISPTNHTGLSSLRELSQSSVEVRVRTARLDSLLDKMPPVALIKIDVEGAESLVMDGLQGCLRRDRPDLIIEVTDEFLRGMGSSAAELIGKIRAFGYRMYKITDHGILRVKGDGEPRAPQFNALFSRRDPVTFEPLS